MFLCVFKQKTAYDLRRSDCSADVCSSDLVWRGHAGRLIPMICELLQGRRPGRILVDCGPGSFTGVRVGIAAARALALGWQVPVSGYSAMTLIAASGFSIHDGHAIAVVMAGGHGDRKSTRLNSSH